jgi:hypothetical protein
VSKEAATTAPTALAHGARRLPRVEVVSYNVELKDENGFVGDRASKGAFRQFVDESRKPLRRIGQDPFGKEQSSKIAKKKLDDLLSKGDVEAAGIVQSAIESFAQELAGVLRRFLSRKEWKDAERIVFGGGFSGSRVGELAIGRASVLLKNEKIKTEIRVIRNDPDEAGLIGAAHLAPTWMFKAHDAILAVDIGGTNIRAGVVQVLATDVVAQPGLVDLFTIVKESDIVTLHVPLTQQTRGMIGSKELATMRRDAILINTARGGLVDEQALALALKTGVIGGAGFDVLTSEPPTNGNVLLGIDLPNFQSFHNISAI